MQSIGNRGHGKRSGCRRLCQNRIPAGKGCTCLPGKDNCRHIPGDYGCTDTNRLSHDIQVSVVWQILRISSDTAADGGIIFKNMGCTLNLASRLSKRLSLFSGQKSRQRILARADKGCCVDKFYCTNGRRCVFPGFGGFCGTLCRGRDIVGGENLNGRKVFSGCGVADIEHHTVLLVWLLFQYGDGGTFVLFCSLFRSEDIVQCSPVTFPFHPAICTSSKDEI